MSSSTLATETHSRINVRLVGSVSIQDGTNPIKHFLPKFGLLKSNSYRVVLGLPSVGHNWSMWRAVNDPTMRIFGIQHNNKWYFLKVRNNRMIVFKQSIPNMVSTNSSLWFQYVENPKKGEIHSLYHQTTQFYVATINSKTVLSSNNETATDIEINRI